MRALRDEVGWGTPCSTGGYCEVGHAFIVVISWLTSDIGPVFLFVVTELVPDLMNGRSIQPHGIFLKV